MATVQIPVDVDVRVMLTFLELYQTLLGFVIFKLYTDAGLVYPPPLDLKKDENAAGIAALTLQEASRKIPDSNPHSVAVKDITGKDVRHAIKSISANTNAFPLDAPTDDVMTSADADEEFMPQPSKSETQTATIHTLHSLSSLPPSLSTSLFSPYTFLLSREISRPIFEFMIRSFGGRVGWPASLGGGSPFTEHDPSITHVVIDRPLVANPQESEEDRGLRLKRKWVQPQWVVDCINAGKILLEEPYWQGKTLPPHLSPFGEHEGAYDPRTELVDDRIADEEASNGSDVDAYDEGKKSGMKSEVVGILAVAAVSDDAAALRTAELSAEAAGVDYGTFEKEVNKTRNKMQKLAKSDAIDGEKDMNKMMMSNKQKKLYERMKFTQRKRANEVRESFFLQSTC